MKLGIGVVVAIVLQIGGFTWWTAQQAQTIDNLKQEVDRLTSETALERSFNKRRDIEELQEKIQGIYAELDEMDDEVWEELEKIWTELDAE